MLAERLAHTTMNTKHTATHRIVFTFHFLLSKKTNPFYETTAIEHKIDYLVYKLYGLTYDEVLIVDPETPITREEYNNFKD